MSDNLTKLRKTKARFARSANVERDADGASVGSYLPTGRSLDVLKRIATALDRDDVEVAISITGPYGSGKSSLALLVDALLGPKVGDARTSAEEIVRTVAPDTLDQLQGALKRLGALDRGFIRATVTAQREAVGLTILRGLLRGVERYEPAPKAAKAFATARAKVERLHRKVVEQGEAIPSPRDFRGLLGELGAVAPVLLMIDEFGKNLEAFADSHSDADLFLLQELAEWSRGGDDVPLALITLQHMAFDEYAAATSSNLRREWAKVQGRFEDIPYVDSAQHTRALIAAVFEPSTSKTAAELIDNWAELQAATAASLGLNDLASSPAELAACWPLQPISLLALPELCERYGQNERTLFSFLAGHEPGSVASFLEVGTWSKGEPLPEVRLDRLYDYFLEAAANLVNVSAGANRWMEIDSRIRDASAVSPAARRVLKAVGVLNLVSAGGLLRASPALLAWACADGEAGSQDANAVLDRVAELEAAGLLTYRDFADEYRVWQGTDFDIKSSVEGARSRLRAEPLHSLLEATLPLEPVVAARHSHQTGTLRAFKRVWGGAASDDIYPLTSRDRYDGLAIYTLNGSAPTEQVVSVEGQRPVVFVTASDAGELEQAVVEVAAIDQVLAEGSVEDWVAKRELLERRFQAYQELKRAFHETFGVTGSSAFVQRSTGGWFEQHELDLSKVISDCCDDWFCDAPVIRNDIVNRHELSSQAAKARRLLVEAMVDHPDLEGFGIEGFGPERTLYLSVIRELGLHATVGKEWRLLAPKGSSSLVPAWAAMAELVEGVSGHGVRLNEVIERLAAPPWGVREGVAPVLLIAALLLQEDHVALYEHGTYRPRLAHDVLERLLKNPGNFTLRHFGARKGLRSAYLEQLAEALGISGMLQVRRGPKTVSVLAVVSQLVLMMNSVPEFARRSESPGSDAVAVRKAIMAATAPDDLLFKEVPEALGLKPVPAAASGRVDGVLVERFAAAVAALRDAYPSLLKRIRRSLAKEFGVAPAKLQEELGRRARGLEVKVTEAGLKRTVSALKAEIPELDAWTAYVAMSLTGTPPESWGRDEEQLFDVRVKELGNAFQRVFALHGNLGDSVEGRAIRVLVTKPDGSEHAALLQGLGDSVKGSSRAVELAVKELAKRLGIPVAAAREQMLLELLGKL